MARGSGLRLAMEVVAKVTSLCNSGQVTLDVHWLGEVECGVSTAIGGSFDLNENVKKRAHTKMIKKP